MQNILDTTFIKDVKHYIETLEAAKKEFPTLDLTLFYQNLDTLQIEYIGDQKLENEKTDGNYNVIENSIIINKRGKSKDCIYHELNHCASNRKEGIHIYTGFSRKNTETSLTIGSAINEGFTELIAGQFFGKNESYIIQQFYVKGLIDIIGFDKMLGLYFTADFDGFTSEFSKYVSEEEVYTFITLLDRIFYNEVYKPIYSKEDIQDYMNICSNILVRGYKNRLLIDAESLEEKQDAILEYITVLNEQSFTNEAKNYELDTNPSLFIIKEAFSDMKIEYIEEEGFVDISPHLNKREQKQISKQKKIEKSN